MIQAIFVKFVFTLLGLAAGIVGGAISGILVAELCLRVGLVSVPALPDVEVDVWLPGALIGMAIGSLLEVCWGWRSMPSIRDLAAERHE